MAFTSAFRQGNVLNMSVELSKREVEAQLYGRGVYAFAKHFATSRCNAGCAKSGFVAAVNS